eukprot:258789-Heterocapsa_arctica.AAC.1
MAAHKVQGECATRGPTSTKIGRVPKSVQALLPTLGPNQTSQRSALAPARAMAQRRRPLQER